MPKKSKKIFGKKLKTPDQMKISKIGKAYNPVPVFSKDMGGVGVHHSVRKTTYHKPSLSTSRRGTTTKPVPKKHTTDQYVK